MRDGLAVNALLGDDQSRRLWRRGFGLGRRPGHHPTEQIQERAAVSLVGGAHVRHGVGNTPQDERGVPFERRSRACAGLEEHRLQSRCQPLRGQRCRPMLVDDASPRGFERGRDRRRRFSDIVVDEGLQFGRRVLDEERADEEEEPRVPIAEIAHALKEQRHIALLLAHDDGRRMLARAREPRAVAGTLNLHQAFGATADGADLFVERGTAAAGAPRAAERAHHNHALLYNPARNPAELIGTRLAVTGHGCRTGTCL